MYFKDCGIDLAHLFQCFLIQLIQLRHGCFLCLFKPCKLSCCICDAFSLDYLLILGIKQNLPNSDFF